MAEGQIVVGFRIKAATAADGTSFTDSALIGNVGGGVDIDLLANLNNGTAFVLDSGVDVANATDFELGVLLGTDGTVKGYINGEEFTFESASGVPMVFDKW